MSGPDFYSEIARERGAAEGWQWCSIKAIGEDRKNGAALVTGAVYPLLYKSGKRKGETNYSKPTPGTQREFLITFAEYDARVAAYEAATGNCNRCAGTGKYDSGRDCQGCRGTGKPRVK